MVVRFFNGEEVRFVSCGEATLLAMLIGVKINGVVSRVYSCPSQMHGRNIKNNKKLLWLKIVVLVAQDNQQSHLQI